MSVHTSQYQQIQMEEDHYKIQQSFQNADGNDNQKHFNEFLAESYDEYDKKNHCTIGIAPDNISPRDNQEKDLTLQKEQERHINELIDNYNSQMEFYKPQKGKVSKDIKNNSSQIKGENNGSNTKQKNEISPLKQSNHQNLIQNKSQYQQHSQYESQEEKPLSLATVLAEEKQKNQFISASGAANVQSYQNDDYEFCPNCNRKFFSGRLNLHLKSCKPNKPLKPVKKQSQQQNDDRDEQETISQNQSHKFHQNNTQSASTVSFNKNNEHNKSLTPSKKEYQQMEQSYKQQPQKQSYQQPSTQENSDRDDTPNNQSSKYNIEQFENKIKNQLNEQQGEDTRIQCDICGRKFMQDRIEKHKTVCLKSQKSRPVYNSSAARCPEDEQGNKLIHKVNIQPPKAVKKISETSVVAVRGAVGTQAIEQDISNENSNIGINTVVNLQKNNSIVQKTTQPVKPSNNTINNKKSGNGNEEKGKKIPKWKLEHQQFIDNIRYNKMIKQVEKEGGDVSKIEKPVDDLEALGYVQCQFCQRKFAKDTAERHIPLCKNIINRPKPPRQPSRQHSEKLTGQSSQNAENKKQGVKKIQAKNNFSVDDSESQMKSNISSNGDSQQQTNDNSDQTSLFSNKTLNTTNGGYNPPNQKLSAKISSAIYDKQTMEQNQKSRTGLLPDLNIKQSDKKYFTSRKFGSYNNRNSNPNNSSNNEIQNKRVYEDVYTRVQQISSVQCPHCERIFAKHASERHIPICKNIVNRPHPMQDMARNTRQSLPKKVSAQQAIYTQRQSLGHNQQSPRQQEQNKMIVEGQILQKQDSSSYNKIPNSLNSTKPQNFCGFCGFQFAMDHKYCGSCGKKRFSTAIKKTISSNSQLGSKSNFDNSTMINNKTTNIE